MQTTMRGTAPHRWKDQCVKHFYCNVPKLGNVAVSRHAQTRMEEDGISQEAYDKALLEPTQSDVPDGMDIVWRERDGLRIVIITNPTPNVGQSS